VVAAAKEQIDKQVHGAVGVTLHESILRLAEKLPEILPGAKDMFFFGNSGSEAVEGALKLARNVTKRPGIIAFTGSFHGRTMGAASITASKALYRRDLEPFLPSTYFVPYADPYHSAHPNEPERCVEESLNALQTLFDRIIQPSQIATIIVEPIQGEGGYVTPPKEFLKRLREICTQHDILLTFDEIWTGFGRTGEWFAAQSFDIDPDIMSIGKSIASGFPLSAVCAKSDLMKKWDPTVHGTTFGGNPVSCAAANATIDVIREEGVLENTKRSGNRLIRNLRAFQKIHPVIGDVRGVGLMIGMELVIPGTDRQLNPDAAKKVLTESLQRGLLLYPAGLRGHVIRLAPPLIVNDEQIDEATSILGAALSLA
jgi:4-aminobutyrate aminotransferase